MLVTTLQNGDVKSDNSMTVAWCRKKCMYEFVQVYPHIECTGGVHIKILISTYKKPDSSLSDVIEWRWMLGRGFYSPHEVTETSIIANRQVDQLTGILYFTKPICIICVCTFQIIFLVTLDTCQCRTHEIQTTSSVSQTEQCVRQTDKGRTCL